MTLYVLRIRLDFVSRGGEVRCFLPPGGRANFYSEI